MVLGSFRRNPRPLSEGRALLRDISILSLSLLFAVILAWTGMVEQVLTATQASVLLASFLAGMFFTSAFTTAPAIVVLGQLAMSNSLWTVALLGGAGAVVGDLVLFRLFRDTVSDNIKYVLRKSCGLGCLLALRKKRTRFLSILLGGFIIASPLPDEFGLALMGMTRVNLRVLVPVSFVLNSIGIFLIGLAARAIVS